MISSVEWFIIEVILCSVITNPLHPFSKFKRAFSISLDCVKLESAISSIVPPEINQKIACFNLSSSLKISLDFKSINS